MPETLSLLTPAQVALRVGGITPQTVRKYAATGLLTGIRIGPRLLMITEESVNQFIADGLDAARPQGA